MVRSLVGRTKLLDVVGLDMPTKPLFGPPRRLRQLPGTVLPRQASIAGWLASIVWIQGLFSGLNGFDPGLQNLPTECLLHSCEHRFIIEAQSLIITNHDVLGPLERRSELVIAFALTFYIRVVQGLGQQQRARTLSLPDLRRGRPRD